ERQTRAVLPAHTARAEATGDRAIEVARVLPGDRSDFEHRRSGGTVRSFFRRLLWLTRRPARDAELQEELRFHLEEEAEEGVARGPAARDAQMAARRDLGNATLLHEETRALWTWTVWEQFAQDMRYALRTMAANKMFSALAILSLA